MRSEARRRMPWLAHHQITRRRRDEKIGSRRSFRLHVRAVRGRGGPRRGVHHESGARSPGELPAPHCRGGVPEALHREGVGRQDSGGAVPQQSARRRPAAVRGGPDRLAGDGLPVDHNPGGFRTGAGAARPALPVRHQGRRVQGRRHQRPGSVLARKAREQGSHLLGYADLGFT